MMKRFMAVMIFMAISCTSSYADIAYTTSEGNLGLIRTYSSTSADTPVVQYRGAGSSPMVASFRDTSSAKVMLIDRTAGTSASGDTALIFNPGSLTRPEEDTPSILEGIHNTHSFANSYNGRGIFFASEGSASVTEFSTSTMKPVRSYTYTPSSTDIYTPEIKDVLIDYYSIYVLYSTGPAEGKFLRFDGQLTEDIDDFTSITTSGGASSMAVLGNGSIAVAHSGGVEVLSRGEFYQAVSTDAPVKSICRDNSTGFYFITQTESGDTYSSSLYHYRSSLSEPDMLRTGEEGSVCQLLNDEDGGIIAAITGSKILLYEAQTGNLIAEHDSTALEGMPLSLAVTYAPDDYDDYSDNSCNITGLGMILMMACSGMIPAFRKK